MNKLNQPNQPLAKAKALKVFTLALSMAIVISMANAEKQPDFVEESQDGSNIMLELPAKAIDDYNSVIKLLLASAFPVQ